jgi:hypothetical protein
VIIIFEDVLIPFLAITIAELGDKTQLSILLLSSRTKKYSFIFLGVFFSVAIVLVAIVLVSKSQEEKRKREHELELERISIEKARALKEIVMVPCQYCGGVMPQASTFCPNCGAKRTA